MDVLVKKIVNNDYLINAERYVYIPLRTIQGNEILTSDINKAYRFKINSDILNHYPVNENTFYIMP